MDIRMRRVAVLTAVVAIAPLIVLGVVLTASSWWDGVTAALGYLLALGVLREWSLDGYPRRAVFALMFTAASWVVSALTASSPVSFSVFSLVGALLLVRTTRWRLWIVALASSVAAIGATAFAFHPPTWQLAATFVVIPALGTFFIAGVILIGEQGWQVARRLAHAKETESELAVAHERMRFAGDLHDIQGHSLHVVKLKAALAGRLLRADPDRAAQELDEIRRIADGTIVETRALVYAHHELHLTAEVENARRLCDAAGITVAVELDLGADAPPHPLLAQVLREATTNLLRHARPTIVTITASPTAVVIANDGVRTGDGAAADVPLRGLARLRERVEDAGGRLRAERTADGFVVAAQLDPAPDVGARARAR